MSDTPFGMTTVKNPTIPEETEPPIVSKQSNVSKVDRSRIAEYVQATKDPTRTDAKIRSSLLLSRITGMKPDYIWENYDAVAKELAITDKDKEVNSMNVFQVAKKSWDSGLRNAELGLLYYQLQEQGETPELMEKIRELETGNDPYNFQDQPLVKRAVASFMNILAPYYTGGAKALQEGLAYGGGSAAAAAASGIPLIAGPQAALTAVPYAASIGAIFSATFTTGAVTSLTQHMGKVASGHFYRELKEDGVSDDIAKVAARIVAPLESVIEVAQLSAIPGIDRAVGRAFASVIADGSLKKTLLTAAGRYGRSIAEETSEELMQEGVELIAGRIAKDMEESINGTTVKRADVDEVIDRLKNTAIDTALGMSIMGIPGSVMNTVSDLRNHRNAINPEQARKKVEQLADDQEESPSIVPEEERVEMQQEYDELVQKINSGKPTGKEVRRALELGNILELSEKAIQQTDEETGQAWQKPRAEWQAEKQAANQMQTAIESDPLRAKIKQNIPNLTEAETDGAAVLMELRAEALGKDVQTYIDETFAPEVFAEGEEQIAFQQAQKAAVSFQQDGRALLHMSETADFSSWVHEVGHIFRRQLPEQDMAVAAEWAGAKEGWTAQAEEKFAVGFEEYLRSGKAPTKELTNIFQKFALWLNKIYHAVKERWNLTEDIRGVYDRLLTRPETGVAQAQESTLFQEDIEYEQYKKSLEDKYEGESIYVKATDQELETLEDLEREYFRGKQEATPDIEGKRPEDIELNESERKVIEYMEAETLPDNVFLHGRRGLKDSLDTGHVIQTTQDSTVAESYGEGSIWVLVTPPETKTASEIYKDVYKKLKKENKEGKLPLDLEYYAEYSLEEFEDVFNVTDILDAAQAWDNASFIEWFTDAFPKEKAVIFEGGHYGNRAAVFLDTNSIEKNYISRERYDAYYDSFIDILYQPDEHYEAVQNAVEQGKYVPDNVLQEYATEPWAEAEFEARNQLIEEATGFDTMDEFVDFAFAMEMSPHTLDYYKEIYRKAQETAEAIVPREEANRRWLASMDKAGVEAVLGEIAVRDEADALHPIMKTAALKLKKGEKISDAHYKKIYDQLKDDPTQWRELFAGLTQDSEELQMMQREAELQPDLTEIEKLREANRQLRRKNKDLNTSWENNQTEIRRLRNRLDIEKKNLTEEAEARKSAVEEARLGDKAAKEQFRDTIKSAREEAKKQTVEERKRVRQELQDRYKTKNYIAKMIRRIKRKPTATIAWEYQQKMREIQEGLYTYESQRTKAIEKSFDRLRDSQDPELIKFIEKQLSKQSLKKMTVEELEAIDKKLESLRKKGREVRNQQILEELIIVENMKQRIKDSLSKKKPTKLVARGSKEGKKASSTNPALAVWLETLTPDRVTQYFDGNEKAAFYELLVDEFNNATDEYLKAYEGRTAPILNRMKELGLTAWKLGGGITIGGYTYTRQDVMGFYIQKQNPESRLALIYGEDMPGGTVTIDKFIAQLTKDEIEIADMIMDDFGEENFTRLQKVLVEVRNEGMEKVANYFPMLRMDGAFTDLDSRVVDDMLKRSGKSYPTIGSGWRHSRQQIKAEHQSPIRHDAFGIWLSQVEAQEKYIAMQRHIKRVARVFVADKEIQEEIRSRYGQYAVDWIKQYISDHSVPNIYNQATDKVSRLLRAHRATAALAFNFITPLKQLPSLAVLLGRVSPMDLSVSAAKFLTNPKRMIDHVNEMSPQIKNRSQYMALEEIKRLSGKRYEQVIKQIGTAGTMGIHVMDMIAVTIGWDASFKTELRKLEKAGVDREQAVAQAKKAATQAIMETQPSARVQNLPQLYRSGEGLKWFLMFSNQLNKIWNMATYDIPSAVKQKEIGKAVGLMTGIAISALGIGAIGRKRLPEDVGEAGEDLLMQLLNSVPLVGRNVANAVNGWYFATGLDPLPVFTELGTMARELFDQDGFDEREIEAIYRFLMEGVGFTGLPSVQLNRLKKALFEEGFQDFDFDPWELFGGPPEERED